MTDQDCECQVVQEVIAILKEQREIMNRNWGDLDVDQIQSRWWVLSHVDVHDITIDAIMLSYGGQS